MGRKYLNICLILPLRIINYYSERPRFAIFTSLTMLNLKARTETSQNRRGLKHFP
jgi:hypothetical protein